MGNRIYCKTVHKVRYVQRVELTAEQATLNLLSSSFGVSLPGICATVHRIPRGYRELTPSFPSTIPIELVCALSIDRQYPPVCLISSLDFENFTPRFPLVRTFSFQSFFSSLACVFQRSRTQRFSGAVFRIFIVEKVYSPLRVSYSANFVTLCHSSNSHAFFSKIERRHQIQPSLRW